MLETYFFEKNLGISRFLTVPLKLANKSELHPWKFCKIVLHPLEILRSKTKTNEIPHDFFLITPGNYTLFLINPWKFRMLFLGYPGNSISSTTPVWFFFSNNPLIVLSSSAFYSSTLTLLRVKCFRVTSLNAVCFYSMSF